MSETKLKFLIILILSLGFAYIAWPSEHKPGFKPGSSLEAWKLNLGLDLQGGAWFRVRLKAEGLSADEVTKGTEEAQSILERRVNLRGLKEPRISRVGTNEIQIEVPGLKTSQQVEDFKKVILSAGHLEFHLGADEQEIQIHAQTGVAPPGTRFYVGPSQSLLCKSEVTLDGKAVEDAKPGRDEGGKPSVNFTLTPEAGRRFEAITKANKDRQLAIILDDRLVSAPVIRSTIGREGEISGRFSVQEVNDMVTVLTTGSLVAPLEMVGSSFLGAALGQDAVDRGLKACYFSLIIVMLFMLGYYRQAGLVANVAILMNLAFMMGLLAILGATLTLPGIAGLVLTMGMAVDANIVVFERMREERDRGKNALQCLDAGYERALPAIVDANMTTLLTGVVLYYFGSGPIQGFAATLSIGIFTTLFTTLTCSKTIMKLMLESGILKEWSMARVFAKPNFGFMKIAPKAAGFSVVLVVIGVVVWFARGTEKYGIDFRGGVAVQMRFNKPTPIEDVRRGIAAISGESGPKYPGAEVQSVILGADSSSSRESMQFQIRALTTTGVESEDPEKFKESLVADLRKQFAGAIPSPALEVGQDKFPEGHPYFGGGTIRISLLEPKPAKETVAKMQKLLDQMGLTKPAEAPVHIVKPLGLDGKPTQDANAAIYEIFLTSGDFSDRERLGDRIQEQLKGLGMALSGDPFPSVETVSASIVTELKEKAIIALIISWLGIILYLAVRFEFRYGVAAVAALVHDSVIAVTWTTLIDWMIPKSFGIDLSVSLTTVAAALTVVGYSVNDTVIIYDRLRENFREARYKSLAQLIDDALNQTLSRTIITSLTVFFTTTVLLIATLTSGGGIAGLAMPMLIGVIVGSYSTLFIATPLIYWWRGGAKAKMEPPAQVS
ncbi:MAG: protein translocase subunit SecD [Candidatus Brocadiae bacterium]|nr:protein translocase subunit SecD [Candidatus Brocadiia bacterium]